MSKINSKNKGADYELKIAKILSSWWGEKFNRTPMSGGLHWKADNRVVGDIVTPPNSIFPYSIECKKRQGWEFDHLIKGTGEIEGYWEQCTRDAENAHLKPLLIFSKNFAPNYAMMRLEDFVPIVEHMERLPITTMIINVLGREPRIIFILDEFIKFVSKNTIIEVCEIEKPI